MSSTGGTISSKAEMPCPCDGIKSCPCAQCTIDRAQKYQELQETPIYRLPAELIVNICERVDLVDFPAFLIATYHLLRIRGVIPPYPSLMLKTMLLQVEAGVNHSASLLSMPKELLLEIGQTLTIHEKVLLVLATHRMRPEEVKIITHIP
ncbi:MAG: hypothetical protein Q9196_004543 [Gyalolechia fulgens]